MVIKNMDNKSLVEKQQIEKAVAALRTYVKKTSESSKTRNLIDTVDSEDVHIQFSYKLVPKIQRPKINVILDHSLVESTTSICLFVKDLVKTREYEKTVRQYKEILAARGINYAIEIFPMKKLKLEYSDFEAKRNLSNAYDLFLCDARVTRLLPALLGKHFIGRKRFPLQVRLEAKDLKKEFNTALHTSTCDLSGRGSSCQMTVGSFIHSDAQLVDNIMTSIAALGDGIPGGPDNIRNLVLKTAASKALPIYLSLGSKADVVLPKVGRTREEPEQEEITTVLGARVSVNSRGVIKIISNKSGTVEEIEMKDNKAEDKTIVKTKIKREKMKNSSAEKVMIASTEKVTGADKVKTALISKVKSASTDTVKSTAKDTSAAKDKVKIAPKEKVKSTPQGKVISVSTDKIKRAPKEKVKSTSKDKVQVDQTTKSTKRRKLA